jgi:hypothetical protein
MIGTAPASSCPASTELSQLRRFLAKPHGQQRSRFAAFGVCVFALAHREPITFWIDAIAPK